MPFVKKSGKKKTAAVPGNQPIFVGRASELHFIQERLLEPDVPDYNLVSFYGQGGVGKSTLLNRLESTIKNTESYKEYCLIARVNERQLTPVHVMETFAEQLGLKGDFEKAIGTYKEALRKIRDEREQAEETFGRKATVTLAGSLAKSVPLVGGPLSQGAEQISELIWDEITYRQRLKDTRHLENPLQDLTDGFLTELNKLAERQGSGNRPMRRILLCFDTFEQLTTEVAPWLLDYFLEEVINENIVLVVSGRYALSRSTPNDPKRWLEYIDGNILHEIELKTFSEKETVLYLAQRGITEETRVSQIWQLSHGLPLYLGMLTANLGGELDPTADVVQNFLRWIPPEEEVKQRLVLDAALLSRAFNRDDLKAFAYIAEEQRTELYRWLLFQPFVRSAEDGRHSYHEVAQEMFGRYLYTNSPEDCRETRRSLVLYYQKALDAVEASEGEHAPEVVEWLELALALTLQLFLLPDEEKLIHAIELVLQAIGTESKADRDEKVSKVLQMLQNELRPQMTQRARKIVESLVFYQESNVDKPERYEVINELLERNGEVLKYSTKTRIIFYLKRADGYYDQKEYEKSLLDLDKILELDPQNAKSYNRKGNALSNLNRYEEALVAYEQAIQLDPTYARAYRNKGITLDDLKRYEEALVAYDQAIQLNPTDVYPYNNKGLTLHALERYEEALVAYDQAIQLNPTDVYPYNNKGLTLHALERYEEALVAYDQALRLDPSNHTSYIGKVSALDGLIQQCKEALVATEQAIALDPSDSVPYQDKSAALNELKRYEEALAANQAIALDPGELVYLVRGKDEGRPAWHYVLIEQVNLPAFLRMLKTGSIDVSEYGVILHSGWGENPPPEIVKTIKSQYL
jgi:tetratricopeptide (TPR) repeat protein